VGKRRERDPLGVLDGVGPKTLERPRGLGVTSVKHLAEFTVEELVEAASPTAQTDCLTSSARFATQYWIRSVLRQSFCEAGL